MGEEDHVAHKILSHRKSGKRFQFFKLLKRNHWQNKVRWPTKGTVENYGTLTESGKSVFRNMEYCRSTIQKMSIERHWKLYSKYVTNVTKKVLEGNPAFLYSKVANLQLDYAWSTLRIIYDFVEYFETFVESSSATVQFSQNVVELSWSFL